MHGRKRLSYGKTADVARTHKDAKFHENKLHYNWRYMRMRLLHLYDDFNNMAIMGKENMQHEKERDVRLAKRLGFIQWLRFSNLGLKYRDTSTTRDRL